MHLTSFTAGLTGILGRQVRYTLPESMGKALKIEITENKAQLKEHQNKAFYLDMEGRRTGIADRPHYGAHGICSDVDMGEQGFY